MSRRTHACLVKKKCVDQQLPLNKYAKSKVSRDFLITSGAAGRKQRLQLKGEFQRGSSALMFLLFLSCSGSRFGLQTAAGCFIKWRPCASFIAMNAFLPGRSEQFLACGGKNRHRGAKRSRPTRFCRSDCCRVPFGDGA